MRDQRRKGRGAGSVHIVEVAPAARDDCFLPCELEDLKVVDEVSVVESALRLEGEAFEDLHFCDDERVLAVVKLGRKVVHRAVGSEGGGRGIGRGGAVLYEGEEVGVGVDEVANTERGFLELGGEEEGAETNVLCLVVSEERRRDEDARGSQSALAR